MCLGLFQSSSLSGYDFAQQTGRAGRDGLPATSILFWKRHQLQTIQTKADDDYMAMKEWVQNVEVCLRGLLQWAMDADEGKETQLTQIRDLLRVMNVEIMCNFAIFA